MNALLTRTAAVALAAFAVVAASAAAADAATTRHVIDSDSVRISSSAWGQVYGTAYEVLDAGAVQLSFPATVARYTSGTGCVLARAIYTYADGSTQTQDSPRACTGGLTVRELTFRSSTSLTKDLVRYDIQLMSATDSTAPPAFIAHSPLLVGDAPDSFGTAARLDHDVTNAVRSGETVFYGSADYSLAKIEVVGLAWWDVRARVIGDLFWSDKLVGSYAVVYAKWTYADGSTGSSHSDKVYRDHAPVPVDLSSDKYKDVVSIKITVYTDSTSTFGGAVAPDSRFGDWSAA